MGAKSGGDVQVSEHYMSLHVGVCAHSADLELLAVHVGEKEAWRGRAKRNTVFQIDQPDLFGGNKKEGGVKGLAWWLNGNPKQVLPGPLFSRLGLTKDTCPGFRGLASIFFTGLRHDNTEGTEFHWPTFQNTPSGETGFHWITNNPYMKPVTVRVRRASKGLNPSIALIRMPDDSNGNEQWAANPAHMIFECMTNRDWGMGESFGAFNIASYEQAAQVLHDENFGLNMVWTRQSKIEDFVNEILDHIQGAQFVDPATGKHTLKLLRAVDPSIPVPKLSPDNAQMSNFAMKLWGEITNEVVVTWTNPETGKEETVTAQDLAAIAMQGAHPSSDSRNYYGIPSQALAIAVAERDLAAVVHPIVTCDVEVTKEFWRTVIYDVVELSWPERGIESAFFRVSQPTAGTTSNTVKLSIYEDVFSLDRAAYLTPSDSGWTNSARLPAPLVHYQIGTAPAFMTAAALGLNDPGEIPYPEAITAITIGPDGDDDLSYELIDYVSTTTGTIVQRSLGERNLRGTWATATPLMQESSSVIAAFPGILGSAPEVGQFVLIGQVADELTEIAVVEEITPAGYVLSRGVLDTVPKYWPAGSRMWFVSDNIEPPDATRRAAYETASYHFLTRTSQGLLPLSEAPQIDVLLSERPHRPNRPTNVLANGFAFGTVDFGGATSIPITWSRRNRINESTQVMRWTDGDMEPEPGQTTSLHVMRPDRTPIATISGIEGVSYMLSRAELAGNTEVILRVVAVRDEMESLQGHEIAITITEPEGEEILALSGDETGTLLLSGDMAPGNLLL